MEAFADWLDANAGRTPHKAALIFEDQTISYAELAARSARLAAWLQNERGLAPGARIAWLGFNTPDMLAMLFACARTALVMLPLNWRLSDEELAAIVADAGATLAVVDRSCADRADALAGVPLVYARERRKGLSRLPDEDGDPGLVASSFAAPERGVLLIYTSGTTGRAKGALLTQDALCFNARNAQHMHGMQAADRILTVLPMFHVGGINIQTLPALECGATVILEARFDAARTLALIAQERPTLTVQVPATLVALLAHSEWADTDISCLRACATGSTDVPLPLIEALHARGVPVIQIYGATETGPVAIYQCIEHAYSHAGSIGRCGLHTEVRLVDECGHEVADGVPGEILVRGPHVACGYWDHQTRDVTPFVDGWFVSGDVAERDAQGFFWFKDRRKHVIISGGENIYPAELERVIAVSGLLREAAVAGRADAHWGEVPVVVAVRASAETESEDVLRLFDGHLARYKLPKDVVFVDALPRNAMGKVEVQRLRELVKNDNPGDA
ncbi:MAG: AMP-binding protein [Gammaproteobacteria bacterium]|nr:AMP-binding protein [Gammaproteobacteria bacterium]